MTARAERGPQWDIGTQQYVILKPMRAVLVDWCHSRFMVDHGSSLYYDSSPLLEYLKENKAEGEEGGEQSNSDRPSDGPGTPQTRRSHGLPPTAPNHISFSPRTPGQQFPPGQAMPGFPAGMPPLPGGQFYPNGGGPDQHMGSPMRIGGMGLPGDAMGGMSMGSPEVGRRMTRGMAMGGDSFSGMPH